MTDVLRRLPTSLINVMVVDFVAANTDEPRKTLVDQLGMHPLNHAEFAYRLSQYGGACCPHFWLTYLELTKWMGGDINVR